MNRKPRAVLPLDLDLDQVRTAHGAAAKPAFLHEQVAPSGGIKEQAAATTLYLMPNDHRRLRVLAINRGVSMQTLLLDALDLLMAGEGQQPVERWETRRRRR